MTDENDIVALDIELEPIRNKAEPLTDAIRELTVDSQQAAGAMADLLKVLKQQITAAETARKRLVKPLNDHVKWINGEFKLFTGPLSEADTVGRRKLADFERERAARERAQREEAERAHRQRMEKLAESQRAAGAATEAEKTLAAPPPAAAKQESTRGVASTASTRTIWKYELIDIEKVPRQYLALDSQAVNAALREGARDIPGLRIYEDAIISIR